MEFYKKVRILVFLVFIALIILGASLFVSSSEETSLATIREFSGSFGVWLPVSFMLFYVLASIFFPTTPLMALAGVMFGFKYGLLYTTIAGLVSAVITFRTSRFLGRDLVEKLFSTKYLQPLQKYDEKLAKHGIVTVIVLRMTPIMPFNVLNFLMGISGISTKKYTLGTLLGLAPSNVLTVYFGSLIVSLLL